MCMSVFYYISLVLYRTEKDKAPPSPLLTIKYTGRVYVQNDQVLVSTCRMQVYKFPFDVQSCTLSFKSVVHSGERLCFCVSAVITFTLHYICAFFNSIFFFHYSRRNKACSQPELFGGHQVVAWVDADSVRVAVHQHDSHQQNGCLIWLCPRCDHIHCK